MFVGSPPTGQAADELNMVKLAKKLKKNNVAVDFVAFGDGIEEGPLNVLRTFSETASSGDNSYVVNLTLDRVCSSYICPRHYIAVQPGQLLLSDALVSSAILAADRGLPDELMTTGGPSAQGEGGATNQFEFGVDPSLDPELAMVSNAIGLPLVLRSQFNLVGSEDVNGRGASTPNSSRAINGHISTGAIYTKSRCACACSRNRPRGAYG